jgi:hypothetical protein
MNCQILGLAFMSPSWFDSLGQVATYDAFMLTQDYAPALRYHRRVLQLLQWKNPRKRWVLKDTTHIDRLDALFAVYPDVRLVWPHRDPVRAMASVVSLLGTIQWGRSDYPFKGGSFEFVLDPELAAQRYNGFIDKLEAGIVPKAQLYSLQYNDLVRDPIGSVESLYRYFGIEFTDAARAAMTAYMAANPRDARPAHKVERGSEAVIAKERQAFRRYQAYFGVASE